MNKIILFFKEVKSELQKITCPKRDELIGSTIIVFLLVIFLGAYLGLVDSGCAFIIKKLFYETIHPLTPKIKPLINVYANVSELPPPLTPIERP